MQTVKLPWMRTKQAAENNNLVFTRGHFLEAVDFILPLGITDVEDPRFSKGKSTLKFF